VNNLILISAWRQNVKIAAQSRHREFKAKSLYRKVIEKGPLSLVMTRSTVSEQGVGIKRNVEATLVLDNYFRHEARTFN